MAPLLGFVASQADLGIFAPSISDGDAPEEAPEEAVAEASVQRGNAMYYDTSVMRGIKAEDRTEYVSLYSK